MVLIEFSTPSFEKEPTCLAHLSVMPKSEIRESKHGHEIQEIICLWNSFALKHHLPGVATPLARAYREQALRRLEESGWLSAFRDSLEYMATDKFFLGKNPRGWKANLTYALRPKTAWDLSQRLADKRSITCLSRFDGVPSLSSQLQEIEW